MEEFNKIWTEKYRPHELKDLIVPERISKKLDKGVYQNLLFYGGPGSGKTSLVDLIMGLIKPTKGQVLIDNEPLNSKNIRKWQNNLSFVSPQNLGQKCLKKHLLM